MTENINGNANGNANGNGNMKMFSEGFDGIRHDNSRIIFGLLLSFIIVDLIYTMNTS